MNVRWLLTLGLIVACTGCVAPNGSRSGSPPSTAQALSYAGPHHLDVLPFTKPKSFDQDLIPDGIEVTLRTLDAMNDPVKAWGTFHFELSRYRPASGDPHGDALQSWTHALGTVREQAGFWDRVTQTYRFQLGWEGTPLEPRKKYVLDVSFNPPWGDRVYAAPYVFEFTPDLEGMTIPSRLK